MYVLFEHAARLALLVLVGTMLFAAYGSRYPNARKTQGRETRLPKGAGLAGTGIASEREGDASLKGVRT